MNGKIFSDVCKERDSGVYLSFCEVLIKSGQVDELLVQEMKNLSDKTIESSVYEGHDLLNSLKALTIQGENVIASQRTTKEFASNVFAYKNYNSSINPHEDAMSRGGKGSSQKFQRGDNNNCC